MKYYIKIKDGISDQYYSTTKNRGVHGPGQGGRGSPSIWVELCSIILDCLAEKSKGMSLCDPTNTINLHQHATGFVDDISTYTGNLQEEMNDKFNIDKAVEDVTTTTQWWEQLLHSTGGKLELAKCATYMISWEYDKEGKPSIRPTDNTRPIIINDSETQQKISIKNGNVQHYIKTLGVFESPSGDYKHERQRLSDKAKNIARIIATHSLTRSEAHAVHRSYYIPSITYSFSVGGLSLQDSIRLQQPVISPLIQAHNFPKSMPREVVFGPTNRLGLGIRHLFTEQGAIKVTTILRTARSGSSRMKNLLIYISWAQHVTGISAHILQYPNKPIPPIGNQQWLHTLREFLAINNFGIQLSGIRVVKTRRVNDTCLADKIALENRALATMLNRCRLYLRVETLSDCCNANGTHLRPAVFKCQNRQSSESHWPLQSRPGTLHRRAWRKFMLQWCNDSTSATLTKQLGHWVPDFQRNTKWEYYCNSSHCYKIDSTGIISTDILKKDRRKWKISPAWEPSASIPGNAVPVDIIDPTSLYITAPKFSPAPEPETDLIPKDSTKTWIQHVQSLPDWAQDLLPTQANEIHTNISKFTIAVSDGSHDEAWGAYGWVIGDSHTTLFTHSGVARGYPMSSHRSEAYGILSLVLFIQQTIVFSSTKPPSPIEIFCDNKAVITILQDTEKLKPNNVKNDILAEIVRIIQEENTMAIFKHVKGHQDPTTTELARPAILNLLADKLAASALDNAKLHSPPDTIPTQSCTAQLTHKGRIVSSKESNILRTSWNQQAIDSYYKERWKLSSNDFQNINWEAIRSARQGLTISQRTFWTKLACGWLPTGHQLHKYGRHQPCPYCNHEDETFEHILQCTNNTDTRTTFIKNLKNCLTRLDTAPSVQQVIETGVQGWLEQTITEVDNAEPLGWGLWMRGIHSQVWLHQQTQYISATRPPSDNSKISSSQLARKWNRDLLQWQIHSLHYIWQERNQMVHQSHASRQEHQVNTQIRHMYTLSEQLRHHDRQLLEMPLDQRLNQPARSKLLWAAQTFPSLIASIKQQQLREKANQSDIRDYLRPRGLS